MKAIHIYTDGSCINSKAGVTQSFRQGPMGLGVVIVKDNYRTFYSKYLGIGTSGEAELRAILFGLQKISTADYTLPVRVFTDYEVGTHILKRDVPVIANVELVKTIRELRRSFANAKIQFLRQSEKQRTDGSWFHHRTCHHLAKQAAKHQLTFLNSR